MLCVPEEETSTPPNLIKISLFAAAGFLLMAAMVEPNVRAAPLFVGGLILALLSITAGWMKWQQRYGSAYLKATTELAGGRVFQGEIETGLTRKPASPISITIDFPRYQQGAGISVIPEQLRLTPSGRVVIPFSISIPGKPGDARPFARVYVRTRTWPIGWGATFAIRA